MTIPIRPEQASSTITSANSMGSGYEVTLQDGTVLWIPDDPDNADYAHVGVWAEANNVEL